MMQKASGLWVPLAGHVDKVAITFKMVLNFYNLFKFGYVVEYFVKCFGML